MNYLNIPKNVYITNLDNVGATWMKEAAVSTRLSSKRRNQSAFRNKFPAKKPKIQKFARRTRSTSKRNNQKISAKSKKSAPKNDLNSFLDKLNINSSSDNPKRNKRQLKEDSKVDTIDNSYSLSADFKNYFKVSQNNMLEKDIKNIIVNYAKDNKLIFKDAEILAFRDKFLFELTKNDILHFDKIIDALTRTKLIINNRKNPPRKNPPRKNPPKRNSSHMNLPKRNPSQRNSSKGRTVKKTSEIGRSNKNREEVVLPGLVVDQEAQLKHQLLNMSLGNMNIE